MKNVNQLNSVEEKLTEKETMDSMGDWENCKGQCGYTRFSGVKVQRKSQIPQFITF